MDDQELMRLSNHHASLAPVIEERPGRYLGYFENKFGEQLVFVHDDGESDAVVLLGDLGWEPCRVSDTGGLPDAGDVILNDEERAFVERLLDRDRGGDVKAFGRPLAGMVATVCRERRPAVEALGPRGWGLVGGGVAADREDGEDRGEFCQRVADERAVDVDHLEREPGGRALGEEAIERAVCAVQRDGQAELVA